MTEDRLKQHDIEERFVCLSCAMIYRTNIYSDREPFRKYYDKIWAKCPRCNCISYKPIAKPENKVINSGEDI